MNNDRIIMELLNRVLVLEEKVEHLSKLLEQENPPQRSVPADNVFPQNAYDSKDTTKYLFNGVPYGKGRLVLAVIKEYVRLNPEMTALELTSSFSPKIQGSLGVVRTLEDARDLSSDYERRFFTRENELIHTATEDCVVCSQWGKFNINNFIRRAEELGFTITTI